MDQIHLSQCSINYLRQPLRFLPLLFLAAMGAASPATRRRASFGAGAPGMTGRGVLAGARFGIVHLEALFLFTFNPERLKLNDVTATLFVNGEVDAMNQSAIAAPHVIILHTRFDPVTVKLISVSHFATLIPPRQSM